MTAQTLFPLVEALERQRFDAMVRSDVAALDALLSDELHYGHSSGFAEGKAAYLDAVRRGVYVYRRAESVIASVVDLGPDACMVCGDLTLVGVMAGEEKVMASIYIANWRRETGIWRFVAHQSAQART